MRKRTYVLAVVLLACVGVVLAISFRHGDAQRRTAAAAVNRTLDAHSHAVGTLLTSMATSPVSEIEDAIYRELQTRPATSLLRRDDIRVEQVPGTPKLRCVVTAPAAGAARVIAATGPDSDA